MSHDLKWFEEYAENTDMLMPLLCHEWKELADLLHEVNRKNDQLATLIDNWQAFVNESKETRHTCAAYDPMYVQAYEECLDELRAVVEWVDK